MQHYIGIYNKEIYKYIQRQMGMSLINWAPCHKGVWGTELQVHKLTWMLIKGNGN